MKNQRHLLLGCETTSGAGRTDELPPFPKPLPAPLLAASWQMATRSRRDVADPCCSTGNMFS